MSRIMFLRGWGKQSVSLIPPDFPFHSTPEKKHKEKTMIQFPMNWNWEHATDLQPSLTFYFFIHGKRKRMCAPFLKTKYGPSIEDVEGLHGGVCEACALTLLSWKSLCPTWSLEFDIPGTSQMIPAFLLIVYRLCPLLLITEPSINLFFIYKYIYV